MISSRFDKFLNNKYRMKYNDFISLALRYLAQSVAGYLLLRFFPGNNFKPRDAVVIVGVIMIAYIALEYLVSYLHQQQESPKPKIRMVKELNGTCGSCAKPKNYEGFENTQKEEKEEKVKEDEKVKEQPEKSNDEKSNDDTMIEDELQDPKHKLTANKYLLDADYKNPESDIPLAETDRTKSDWDSYMNKKHSELLKEKASHAQQFMIKEEARLKEQADLINKRRQELKNNAAQYEKEIQARMDPFNDSPKNYSGSDEKTEVVKVDVPAKKITMEFIDHNSLPVSDYYRTANEEFGYSYLKAEDWEKVTPPKMPVCVSDNKSPVFASYTEGAPLDAKIWYNSRFSTNFKKVDNDKIKASLDHK